MLSGIGVHAGLFLRSRGDLDRPDMQITVASAAAKRDASGARPYPFSAFTLAAVHLREKGRGSVQIQSPDPVSAPRIRLELASTPGDIAALMHGVRTCLTLTEQPSLRSFTGLPLQPIDLSEAAIRRSADSFLHPTSTCSMGKGPNAVVDAHLRVQGVAGLRIADASIFPTITSGNTNAPTIMVGEKAADMILADAW
jgi:choline dehydrogenase